MTELTETSPEVIDTPWERLAEIPGMAAYEIARMEPEKLRHVAQVMRQALSAYSDQMPHVISVVLGEPESLLMSEPCKPCTDAYNGDGDGCEQYQVWQRNIRAAWRLT